MEEGGSQNVKDYKKMSKRNLRRDKNLNFHLGSIFEPPACSIN